MKKRNLLILFLLSSVFLFIGCTEKLDETKQKFEGQGATYEMQLPANWEVDNEDKSKQYGLKTSFSAEDKKSNSYMFIAVAPVESVEQKGFAEKTREQLSERYGYKNSKDIYMKELTINGNPACKYTLNTVFKEKNVWAHLYYIWTKHEFVQLTFYSADDSKYEQRSKIIDESVDSLKEVKFNEELSKKVKEDQKKEEGDIYTVENEKMKVEITAVRKLTGENKKNLLAVRYTFTNLQVEPASPSSFVPLITTEQNEEKLALGKLSESTTFLDVKELANAQNKRIAQGESVESVLFYELKDDSSVKLSFSQEAFPGTQSTTAVVPK